MFFTSVLHPPCVMNRYSVVAVPNGHPDGVTYYGKSFKHVPLLPGKTDLRYAVEEEARVAGYTYRYEGQEKVWRKPDPNPQWNLYAEIVDGRVRKLILPDEVTLELPAEPAGANWYAVRWPVNPHFTGERMITEMIESGYPNRQAV